MFTCTWDGTCPHLTKWKLKSSLVCVANGVILVPKWKWIRFYIGGSLRSRKIRYSWFNGCRYHNPPTMPETQSVGVNPSGPYASPIFFIPSSYTLHHDSTLYLLFISFSMLCSLTPPIIACPNLFFFILFHYTSITLRVYLVSC